MANLSKQQIIEIIQNAPAGTTPEGVVAALRQQGHQLEGYGGIMQPIDQQKITERPKTTLQEVGSFLDNTIKIFTEAQRGTPLASSIMSAKAGIEPVKKVVGFLTKTERKFGRTLGAALIAPKVTKQIQELQQRDIEMNQKIVNLIEEQPQGSEEQKQLVNLLKERLENRTDAREQLEQILPEASQSTKQIIGQALGVVADVALFGTYGKAAIGAKTGVLAVGRKGAQKLGELGVEKGISLPFTKLLPKAKITSKLTKSMVDDMAIQAGIYGSKWAKIINNTSLIGIKNTQQFAQKMLKAVGMKAPQGVKNAIINWSMQAGQIAVETGVKQITKLGAKTLGKKVISAAKKGVLISGTFGTAEALQEDKKVEEIIQQGTIAAGKGALLFGGLTLAGGIIKIFGSRINDNLKEKAFKQFQQGLGATTKTLKAKGAKVSKEAIEKGIWGTQTSLLKKAQQGQEKALIEFEKIGKLTGRIKIKRITKVLDRLRNNYIVSGKNIKPQAVDAINEFRKILSQFGKTIDAQDLRKIKSTFDKEIAAAGGKFTRQLALQNAPTAQIELERITANRIRRELAKKSPKFAKINKEYSFWKSLDEVLDATIKRKAPQQTPVGQRFFQAVGLVIGAPVGIAKAILTGHAFKQGVKIFNSTAWRTASAVTKNRLANILSKSIMTGDKIKIENAIKLLLRELKK